MDDIQADLMLLRDLVSRELETINRYRELATACADDGVRDFFLHIVDEEKFHIADTLRAIATIDQEQSDLMRIGFTDGHVPGQLPPESVAATQYPLQDTFRRGSVDESTGSPPPSRLGVDSDAGLRSGSIPSGLSEVETGSKINRGETRQNRSSIWTVGSLRGVPQSH